MLRSRPAQTPIATPHDIADPLGPYQAWLAGDPRPRVLFVPETRAWSFDYLAREVAVRLDTWAAAVRYAYQLGSEACDVAVALWWGHAPQVRRKTRARAVVALVSDYASWRLDAPGFAKALAVTDVVAAATADLATRLRDVTNLPVVVCEDAVDTNVFTPKPQPAGFRVGWVGNSKFQGDVPDYKGLGLLREACRRINAPLVVRDVAAGVAVPRSEMPAWYALVSCLGCASVAEGGPNPVLEALASARPVVSTAVGLVPGLVVDGVNGYVVSRDPEALAGALDELRNGNLGSMGAAARAAVLAHDRGAKLGQWRACLDLAYKVARARVP